MSHDPNPSTRRRTARQRAGVFDIRSVIGLLLGIYGVVMVIMGLVATGTAENPGRTADINVNLWSGIGLIIAAVVFFAWVRLRPLLVPVDHTGEEAKQDPPPSH